MDDESKKVALADAIETLRALLCEQLKLTGRLPKTVVTVGETALAALSIRAQSDDLDVYMSELDDTAVSTVQEIFRQKLGPNFKIDATPVNTIWGAFAVQDIDESPPVETLDIEGTPVQIRALSAETLYLIKVAADRPKDRDDVVLIGAKCTYESVLARAKRTFAWYADRSAFPEFVERLARCMARDFGIRLKTVDRDFGLPPVVAGKVAEIRNALEAQFLNILKAAMARRPDLIRPPEDGTKMTFDAVAAGAPEEIVELIKHLPEETSDLATNVLKSADPKRHFEWIASRVSAKSRAVEAPFAEDSGRTRRLEIAAKIIERARNDGTTSSISAEILALYGTEESLTEILGHTETLSDLEAVVRKCGIDLPGHGK
jgi:hypothetical protein